MGRPGTERRSYHASDSYTLVDAPLVVLVDRYSASASEIVAGAIQDWDRGIVAGRPTFGKASVQQIFPMNKGTALKITTARYYTPSGRLIQKIKESRIDPFAPKPQRSNRTYPRRRKGKHTGRKAGRTVYGGGGITPDVEFAVPAFPALVQALNNQSLFIKFATHYVTGNPDVDQATFDVTDEMIGDFRRFAEARSFEYTSMAEQTLNELEEIVQDRTASTEVLESLADLRRKLIRQHEQEYQRHREMLVARIGT